MVKIVCYLVGEEAGDFSTALGQGDKTMFPISHTGQVELSVATSADIDSVLNGVEQALHKALAINISRNGHQVTFRGGAFRWGIHSGNVLATIGRGEIEVQPGSPGTLRYRFFCLEVLTFVLIAATTFGLLTRSLLVFAIAFLWLFGTNYLIGAVRLRRFVRSAAGIRRDRLSDQTGS